MTRKTSIAFVLQAIAGICWFSPVNAQGCAQWDATGRWAAVQNNNLNPAIDVRQSGNTFSGTAILNIFGTTATTTHAGSVTGEIVGSRFFMKINWNASLEGRIPTTGVYDGTISDLGMIHGNNFDSRTPNNKVGWHTVRPMRCATNPNQANIPDAACSQYAASAMAQLKLARETYNCSAQIIGGPRWSANPQDHENWCKTVNSQSRASETNARSAAMNECRPNRDTSNPMEKAANSVSTGQQTAQGGNFTGTWTTQTDKGWTYTIRFVQSGREVAGSYRAQDGSNGRIQGRVGANVMEFQWRQDGGFAGTGRFTLATDGNSFSGTYQTNPHPALTDPRYLQGNWTGFRSQ